MVLNDLPPLPAALTADDVVPTRTDTLGLTPNRAAVLAALEDGATSSGDIADRTGLAGPAVSKILASLADGGLARKESHGRWAAVGEMAGRR
jgi:DNA-binding MarR family transcriptional regulator